ncbi:MAG: hypothetical protein Q9181_000152 [Wetmoreana brouardii]
MCRAGFKESQNMRINLPEDDPTIIKSIIQYLYAGDFWSLGTIVPFDSVAEIGAKSSSGTLDDIFGVAADNLAAMYVSADPADNLAAMYVTAEKYQLLDRKHLIVKKLQAVTNIRERPIQFFSTARIIYAGIAGSDDVYRDFFKSSIENLPNPSSMSKAVRQAFDECWANGGMLAIDMALFMCSGYEKEFAKKDEALSKSKARIERLERKRAEHRSKCRHHADGMVNGSAGSIGISAGNSR